MQTALSCLTLEIYYRYLPLFKAEAAGGDGGGAARCRQGRQGRRCRSAAAEKAEQGQESRPPRNRPPRRPKSDKSDAGDAVTRLDGRRRTAVRVNSSLPQCGNPLVGLAALPEGFFVPDNPFLATKCTGGLLVRRYNIAEAGFRLHAQYQSFPPHLDVDCHENHLYPVQRPGNSLRLGGQPGYGQGRSLGIPPSVAEGRLSRRGGRLPRSDQGRSQRPQGNHGSLGPGDVAEQEGSGQAGLQQCPGQAMDRGVQGPAGEVHQGQSRSAGSDPGGGPLVGRAGHGRPSTDVLQATYTTDKAEKAKLLAEARKIFEEIRPQFVEALKASAQTAGPAAGRTRRRAEIADRGRRGHGGRKPLDRGHGRFLPGPNPGGRFATHRRADQVDQGLRRHLPGVPRSLPGSRKAFLGCRAHFLHARILQELGKINEAKDVYEEVAACDRTQHRGAPTSKPAADEARPSEATGLEGFFANVEQYYLQTLYQLNKKDYLEEVETWRACAQGQFRKMFRLPGIDLGICQELAGDRRAVQGRSQQELAKAKALKLLGEMAKIPSPYQEDAIKLRRQLNPNGTAEEGFEDAVIDGDAAVEKQKWAEAAEFYEKAIAAATPKTDKAASGRRARIRSSPATTTWPCSFTRRARSRKPSPWPRRP